MSSASAACAAARPSSTLASEVLRIVSFNIGMRGLEETLKERGGDLAHLLALLGNPDILCLQETKTRRIDLLDWTALADGYTSFFSFNTVKGKGLYSGVATIVKNRVPTLSCEKSVGGGDDVGGVVVEIPSLSVDDALTTPQIPLSDLDAEGRCLITDHGELVLINVYVPALTELSRLGFKWKFHEALRQTASRYAAAGRRVVVVGDLNVAHLRLDHRDPSTWEREYGHPFELSPFRRWMEALMTPGAEDVDDGGGAAPPVSHFVDPFRVYHPTRVHAYTCWSTATGARANNFGSRLDYTLVSSNFPVAGPGGGDAVLDADDDGRGETVLTVVDADIMQQFQGSDHCPVFVTFAVRQRVTGGRSWLLSDDEAASRRPHIDSINADPSFTKRQASLKSFLLSGATASAVSTASAVAVASSSTSAAASSAAPTFAGIKRSMSASSSQSGGGRSEVAKRKQPAQQQVKLSFGAAAAASSSVVSVPAGGMTRTTLTTSASVSEAVIEILSSQDDEDGGGGGKGTKASAVKSTASSSSSSTCGRPSPPAAAAASAWGALLTGPGKPPTCSCGIPSVQRQVLKQGPNKGRHFFVCSKPEGRKGEPGSRCDFFKWLY